MNRTILTMTAFALAGEMETAGAATLCVNSLGANGCFTTIQAAVDAASPGDTIQIYAHHISKGYSENVVIATANLTLEGRSGSFTWGSNPISQGNILCSKVVVDPCESAGDPASCSGTGFEIAASGVTIRNVTIRHADIAVNIQETGENARIEGICSIENTDGVLAIDGSTDKVQVRDSKFLGAHESSAMIIFGDEVQVRNNLLLNTDGIFLAGTAAQVTGNAMRITTDFDCLAVDSDDAVIHNNILEACEDGAIEYSGNGGELLGNRISNCPDDAIGIETQGDNLVIRYNRIANMADQGIQYFGDNGTLADNDIERAGLESDDEAGMSIEGNNNLIERNTVRNGSSTGITNEFGNANLYRANRSVFNGKSGFRIEDGDGIVLENNIALNNQGEGINNDDTATNTVATGNAALNNRTDVCNDGTFAMFASNVFVSGGTATPCVVEQ